MILELNASDERGIDVVREKIKEFASTRKMFRSTDPSWPPRVRYGMRHGSPGFGMACGMAARDSS